MSPDGFPVLSLASLSAGVQISNGIDPLSGWDYPHLTRQTQEGQTEITEWTQGHPQSIHYLPVCLYWHWPRQNLVPTTDKWTSEMTDQTNDRKGLCLEQVLFQRLGRYVKAGLKI